MQPNKCAACQSEIVGGIGMGGVIVCRSCAPIIEERMADLRAHGKSVDVSRIARDLYREQFSGSDYLLREPPKDLMDLIKHKAVDDGTNMRDIILRALRLYVQGG